ncbi:MAG: DUF1624 domain-containing protein, partial [Ilumatobacteraceae bacterium]|nr:DUF1624 domain-containing protein [Ilumatobacteraceae bacterium]
MPTHASDRQLEQRFASLDVARTIALFGIIVLNYHGYLNFQSTSSTTAPSIFERWWHPFEGALANPFPVGFVMVAGMGVALLLQDVARANAHHAANEIARAHTEARWRLARRGLFLFTLGYGIEWIWAGTILPYYGAYFVVASIIATWSARKLIALAVISTFAAAIIQWWRLEQSFDGNLTTWLSPSTPNTPRDLMIRLFVDYTHPLFPWLAFFIAGILLGRNYHDIIKIRRKLLIAAVATAAFAYITNAIVNSLVGNDADNGVSSALVWRHLVSTQPFDRSVLYVLASLGVVVAVFLIITILCEKFQNSLGVRLAQTTGQLTLTIYLAHIFIYNFVVTQGGLVQP